MFLNEGSGENGEHPISLELIFCKSRRSLLILADVNSLCCSEVEYDSLVNSCIAALYCADIGVDIAYALTPKEFVLNIALAALGSHLERHFENDPFIIVRRKGTSSMLKQELKPRV